MSFPQNQSKDNAAKIAIRPPLPVEFEGISGFLVAVGANRLVIEIENSNASIEKTGFLTISLKSFQEQSLEVTVDDSAAETAALDDSHKSAKLQTLEDHDSKCAKKSVSLYPTNQQSKETLESFINVVRKEQHINICNLEDVEATGRITGLEALSLMPSSLPELSWDDLDTSVEFLGRKFSMPVLITGMTGGVDRGAEINRRLALAAAAHNIPMGVGSQRMALENPKYADIFGVRQYAPDLFLISNLGVSQLIQGREVSECQKAVEMIDANAMAIHVNVLQEIIQEEGQRDFRYFLDRIEKVSNTLNVPVIVKEVGAGIDAKTAKALEERGIKTLDIGGKGGTSWGHIEGLRSNDSTTMSLGKSFRNWGIPTAHSLATIHNELPSMNLIATGGIRDGLMVAKAVAIGAQMVGVGLPLFRAALQSEEAAKEVLETFSKGLKTAMLCSGCKKLENLSEKIRYGSPLESEFRNLFSGSSYNDSNSKFQPNLNENKLKSQTNGELTH